MNTSNLTTPSSTNYFNSNSNDSSQSLPPYSCNTSPSVSEMSSSNKTSNQYFQTKLFEMFNLQPIVERNEYKERIFSGYDPSDPTYKVILSLENNTVYTSVINYMYKIIKKSGGTKSFKLNKIKGFLLISNNIYRGPKISVFRCTNNSRYHLTSPSGRCGVHALYQVIQRRSKSPSDPIRDNVSNIPLDSCHKRTIFKKLSRNKPNHQETMTSFS